MGRWLVSVLSTDYDLSETRKSVIDFLEKKETDQSAFELADFPVEPFVHSHENCIIDVKRAQIAILILNKRYGGKFYADGNVSITEKEYMTAVENGIPCLVFVKKKVWEERHFYRENVEKGENEGEKYKATYVDETKIFELINKIQHIYEDKCVSNWMTQYTDTNDLISKIEGQLRGLSRYWLEQLYLEQAKRIKKRKTSTSELALGDVFDKQYYLEPNCEEKSGELPNGENISNRIFEGMKEKKSILIQGEAGYGKTTILAKAFFKHVNEVRDKHEYHIPLYLWLKSKDSEYEFSLDKYFQESFSEYLERPVYPFLDYRDMKFYFYIDGFDEMAERLRREEVLKIEKSEIFQYPVLLTCRVRYKQMYLDSMANKFDVCLEVKQWSEAKIQAYIDNFCSSEGRRELRGKIVAFLNKNLDLKKDINSPLVISMLLWVIEVNHMDMPDTINTKVELFHEFVRAIAERELENKKKLFSWEKEDLVRVWSYFAWIVYEQRLHSKKADAEQSVLTIQKEIYPELGSEYDQTLFDAIFDLTPNGKVIGSFHEQILEYLVSYAIFHGCINKKSPYSEFLKYVLRPEMNRYFRTIWEEATTEKKKMVVESLKEQYYSNVSPKTDEAVAKRVHAVYFLSRFEYNEREELLESIERIEKNIAVRLSLYFGRIKAGNLEKEEEFYQLLTNNPEYNCANRGYHLAYYSDVKVAETHMPFMDNDDSEWRQTLDAFIRHFNKMDRGHYYLWRIDLLTMRQFMEARKSVGPVTVSILDQLKSQIHKNKFKLSSELKEKIEEEYEKVLTVYHRFEQLE